MNKQRGGSFRTALLFVFGRFIKSLEAEVK